MVPTALDHHALLRPVLNGFRVTISTRVTEHGEQIKKEGFSLSPLRLRRGGMNPFRELQTFIDIFRAIKRERPDIIHLVGLKLILYGSLAALFNPHVIKVSAVSGLGTMFTSPHKGKGLIKSAVVFSLRMLLKRPSSWVIVQNQDDLQTFKEMTRPGHTVLIPSAGVDMKQFTAHPEPKGNVTAVLVARMLGEKGIYETVSAAQILEKRGVPIRIELVGSPDPENPSSISSQTLEEWNKFDNLVWRGHQSDINEVWRNAHIAVLPSYREGFPKSLTEAMACGRPVITTNTVGCREVIEDGVSGFIVPLYDPKVLADALQQLAEDSVLRQNMGAAARERTEKNFSDKVIISQVFALYDRALGHKLS